MFGINTHIYLRSFPLTFPFSANFFKQSVNSDFRSLNPDEKNPYYMNKTIKIVKTSSIKCPHRIYNSPNPSKKKQLKVVKMFEALPCRTSTCCTLFIEERACIPFSYWEEAVLSRPLCSQLWTVSDSSIRNSRLLSLYIAFNYNSKQQSR